MSELVAGIVQIAGGLLLAPLLTGSIQSAKAYLQGRRGPSPMQPYRDLRRLWGKSGIDPQPRTFVYLLAPCIVAGSALLILPMIPVGGVSPAWPIGNDALVLVGLLALARFALALSSWDTGSGFALMGSARDLTIAVFGEALLLLALLVAAVPAASTDLVSISVAGAGSEIWSEPGHWCAAFAFGLALLVETGRQPIDNPDTHLELTMIHEGPLLEYGGRDLAMLQWTAAARHWIFLVLGAGIFLPHDGGFAAQLGSLAAWVIALAGLLALLETAQAKMRILRVPALIGAGCVLALIGLVSSLTGGPA
jgi:formate hydrogenlyase subunit 4